MKFERIDENKIKVFVSQEDLLMHGISFESFVVGTPAVEAFFRDVMQKAEYETNFAAAGGRVIVEAMHLKNDGLVIFITKPDGMVVSPKNRRVRYRVRSHSVPTECTEHIYQFDTFDDLCAFASRWRFQGESSSLYKLQDVYMLTLSFAKDTYEKDYVKAQILEFGTPVSSIKKSYLEEHGQKICDGDAIASIIKHFDRK